MGNEHENTDRPGVVSRRMFVAGGAASLAAFLVACKRGTTAGPTPTGSASLEKALSIYNWENYLNPETLKRFQKEFGVAPTQDYYPSNEDLQAKIKAGAKGYDICAPTLYMVKVMGYEDKTLLPLDKSKIPNLAGVDTKYLNRPDDPNNTFSVPKDLGTTGFGYRADKVTETMTSWEDFFRLAPKYSGRYAVLDSGPEVVGAALKMLGYSYNTTNPSEIKKATDELIKLKPHIRAIDSANYDTMLQKGEVSVALGWNGDVLVAAGNAPKDSVKYVVPTEGTEIWIDNWAILKDAPHPELAHAFLNWILTPEVQGLETSYTYYASPVTAAKQHVDPAVAGDPAVYPPDDVFERLEVASANAEWQSLRAEAFEKFKAA